jgi:hypothetical protein
MKRFQRFFTQDETISKEKVKKMELVNLITLHLQWFKKQPKLWLRLTKQFNIIENNFQTNKNEEQNIPNSFYLF